YEVQTDMSADMSVRGTRCQNTSVRGTVQVAAGQSDRDTWHLVCVSPRRRVSVQGQNA
ncbi:hypothetical protein Tco_0083263, partial [Tanacetum coccineum]